MLGVTRQYIHNLANSGRFETAGHLGEEDGILVVARQEVESRREQVLQNKAERSDREAFLSELTRRK